MRERLKEAHQDQSGAVMMTGLGMACFLIGALWFIIGVGDAIVFRDSMQETADHAAFTSAVLHAKGMNFISACNLIMLALFAIHIIMGIIHDILLAICIAGAVFTFGASCSPWAEWRDLYTGYAKIFKPIAVGVHYLEVGAAYGYPFIGFAKGYTLGGDYGDFGPKKRDLNVLAVSTSMVPGAVLNGPVNALFKKNSRASSPATKKGLPVEAKPMNFVCKFIGKKGVEFFVSASGKSIPGFAGDAFRSIVGSSIAFRYCNDLGSASAGSSVDSLSKYFEKGNDKINDENDLNSRLGNDKPDIKNVDSGSGGGGIDPGLDSWWGKEGPLVPWGGTINGGPWQQVWAINLLPPYSDEENEHRVAIAERRFGVQQTAQVQAYFAQAEFYYDCTKDWDDNSCNGDSQAAFAIKWRARLRRLQFPSAGTLFSSFAGEFLKNIQGYTDLQKFLKNNQALQKLSKKVLGPIGNASLGGAIDGVVLQINKMVTQGGRNAGGGIDTNVLEYVDTEFGLSYH